MRKTMRKTLAFLIVASLLMSSLMFTTALASGEEEEKSSELIAAEALHSIGLFLGMGDDADGNPVFGLENEANRIQGLIMLLRFFGEFEEALENEFENPFADVTGAYNSPIVAYAFEKGLTKGVSATRFDPTGKLTAAHYLTFILRALGYEDGTDFEWNEAWELTDELGITNGEFSATSNELPRGSLVIVSLFALEQPLKDSDETLLDKLIGLEAVPEDAAEGISEATAKINENNKKDDETPDTTIGGGGGGGGGGTGGGGGNGGGGNSGGTDPAPTPTPDWNIAKIPGAQVGDYVRLYAIEERNSNYIYVEVVTPGQITVNTPGTYSWSIISEKYVVTSVDGRTTNLKNGFDFDYDFSPGPGDYVMLVNLVTTELTGYLAVGEDGQVELQDGVYDMIWILFAEDVIISVGGKTTNLDGNPGDFVEFLALDTYDYSCLLEVGEDGEVAIDDGVYVVAGLIPDEVIIISTAGRTTNLDCNHGDFVSLYNLATGENELPLEVGDDGEVGIAAGKYLLDFLFLAEYIMTTVDGKITIPDAIDGYVAVLIELTYPERLGWWYSAVDENGQVDDLNNGKYYLDSIIPLVFSVDGKITGLGSFDLKEFDHMYLVGWDNDNYGYFMVNENCEVQIPPGSYLLYGIYTEHYYVTSVNGATVNLKSNGYEYEEGDYVFFNRMNNDYYLQGVFRVGANGEAAVADGLYYHDGDYVPAANIFVITPPR